MTHIEALLHESIVFPRFVPIIWTLNIWILCLG